MTRLGTEDPAGSRGAGEAACGAAGSLAVAVCMPASLRLVMGAGSGKLKPVSDTRRPHTDPRGDGPDPSAAGLALWLASPAAPPATSLGFPELPAEAVGRMDGPRLRG